MVILRNNLLVAFERVVTLGTVHAAAADLKLTQVAVTKRIKALEAGLKATLFLRSRRGMSLTDEGKALLQYCKSIQGAEGELLGKISGANREDISLTIVGPTSFVSRRLPACCRPLYQKHPFLRLHLRSDDHSNLIELVRRGEADFAIVPPSQVPNEMQSKMLKSDRYLLLASPKWKDRPLSDILEQERIIDFYESDSTTLNYLRQFGLNDRARRSRLFVNENDALVDYLKAGIGYGTLTESVARPYLDSGELIALNKGKAIEDPLALVWYARSKEMAYFEDIVRSIK
ncbi:MAG: LysR family transcriptional regulator [Bdellovibrionia bacterium]